MRGWTKLYEPRPKTQNAQEKELFDSALRLDPDNVDATIGKASCLSTDVVSGWSASSAEDKEIATDLIDRALSKRPASALAHVVKGDTLRFGHPEEALPEYEAALEIDPNFPIAYAGKGQVLILSGSAREAFSPLQLALRVSPKDPFAFVWHWNLCHAHMHLHEYKEAIEACRRSVNMNNSFWTPYVDLISAYGATEQLEQARQTLADFNKIRPNFTVQWFREFGYAISSNPQFRREFDDILDGLRKGGVRKQ